ncbi:hypothetical protein D3C84_333310 [compost metagenome]
MIVEIMHMLNVERIQVKALFHHPNQKLLCFCFIALERMPRTETFGLHPSTHSLKIIFGTNDIASRGMLSNRRQRVSNAGWINIC